MTTVRAKTGPWAIRSWPFGPLWLVGIAIAVLAAPARAEGPILVQIGPGHALAVLDAVALVPMSVGAAWLHAGLWRRRSRLAAAVRASPRLAVAGVFLAGLGLGLLLASVFSGFFWWWAVGAFLVGATTLAAVAVSARR